MLTLRCLSMPGVVEFADLSCGAAALLHLDCDWQGSAKQQGRSLQMHQKRVSS